MTLILVHKNKFNYDDGASDDYEMKVEKLHCGHCKCWIEADGYKIKTYLNGEIKKSLIISGRELKLIAKTIGDFEAY